MLNGFCVLQADRYCKVLKCFKRLRQQGSTKISMLCWCVITGPFFLEFEAGNITLFCEQATVSNFKYNERESQLIVHKKRLD